MAESRAKAGMGGKKSSSKKKSGKKPHEIHIKRGHSGGFLVRHSHKPDADTGETPEDEEHVVPSIEDLHNHIDEAMGDQQSAQAAPPEPSPAAAPAAAPAPAAPPQGM